MRLMNDGSVPVNNHNVASLRLEFMRFGKLAFPIQQNPALLFLGKFSFHESFDEKGHAAQIRDAEKFDLSKIVLVLQRIANGFGPNAVIFTAVLVAADDDHDAGEIVFIRMNRAELILDLE